MISEQIGERETEIVKMLRRTELFEDRSEQQRFVLGDLGTTVGAGAPIAFKQGPTGPWKSIVITRPSYSELFVGNGYSNDIYIVLDGIPYLVSYNGITIVPVVGNGSHQVGLTSDGLGLPASPAWSLDIIWTTRQYELMQYAGF